MAKGYIFLHRKIQDNAFWAERRVFSKAEAWIDILLEAQWDNEVREHTIGMKVITTERGQTIKSLDTWAKRWKWSRDKVRRFALLLESMRMIRYENATKTVRITVLNYDRYNTARNENATHLQRICNASATHLHTDNKEIKEEEKESNTLSQPELSLGEGEDQPKKVKEPTPQADELAGRLRYLVQSKKNVKVDGRKLAQWAKAIHLAFKVDGIGWNRQEAAMSWYEENADGTYVPVIESGKTWREKFLRLEAAMEKADDPYRIITEPYRQTAASMALAAKEEAEERAKAEAAERDAEERRQIIRDLHARHPEWQQ